MLFHAVLAAKAVVMLEIPVPRNRIACHIGNKVEVRTDAVIRSLDVTRVFGESERNDLPRKRPFGNGPYIEHADSRIILLQWNYLERRRVSHTLPGNRADGYFGPNGLKRIRRNYFGL